MRLQSLFALAAAGALLLPFGANAADSWPKELKGPYMDQCIIAAKGMGLSTAQADKHCKCGADAIGANFTTEEIRALDSKNGVDAALKAKAEKAVMDSCASKTSN